MISRTMLLAVCKHWILFLASILVVGSQAAAIEAKRQLAIFCWPGYVPQEILDAFTNETGIEVVVSYYNTNEELLRYRLANSRYDLVQPSDYALEALIQRGELEPLRKERIPNLANLSPEYRGLPQDPEGNFGVPWLAGTTGIVVNTLRVKEPIRGYADVFSGAYRDRIVAINDAREWLGWAMMRLDLPINEVNAEVLSQVESVWSDWIPQIAAFDSDTADKVLRSGRADIAITWSGDAAKLIAESPIYEFILAKEGAHRYVDCLAIPRGAKNRSEAEEFMNFILRPDISVMLSEAIPFTNPNQRALEMLSDEQRSNVASYPSGNPDLRGFRAIGEMSEQVDKLYNDLRFAPSKPR